MDTILAIIRAACDRRTLIEQLVEELAELIGASLKLIRAEQLSFNPTDVSLQEARRNFAEEWRDVQNVLYVLGIVDIPGSVTKLQRWAERIRKRQEEGK